MFKNFFTNKESRNCQEYKAERKIKARTAIAKCGIQQEGDALQQETGLKCKGMK